MTTPTPEQIAGKLTEAQRMRIAAVHPRFDVGDLWRPDEGESHQPYAAMTRLGLLTRERMGDFPTVYSLTDLGIAVRALTKDIRP